MATEDGRDPPLPPTRPLDTGPVQETARPTLLAPGQRLGERYEIRRLLGQGGMGAVYGAWDSLRKEEIALKIMLPELFTHPELRQRFLDEATRTSKLRHEGVITVYDVQAEGGEVFLTMELLVGETLHRRIHTHRQAGQRFTLEETLTIVRPMFTALDYAHKKLIVHRDIKPENVFLCADGALKLMDFGIARFGVESSLTQSGQVMGTLRFMAPEQLRGERVDHRTDQYACGLVLCEILGVDPHAARAEPPTEVRTDVPAAVFAAIERALANSRQERHADMLAFLQALEAAAGIRPESRRGAARPRRWIAVAAVLAAGASGTLAYLNERWPFDRTVLDTPPDSGTSLDALENGATRLMRAAQADDLDAVLRLLDQGAPLEVAGTRDGLQALHVAADHDALDVAGELLARGARIGSLDGSQRNALHHAAASGSARVLELFLAAASPAGLVEGLLDARDTDGNAPLHLAARGLHVACARTLLQKGANRLALNGARNSPLHELTLAEPAAGQVELAELLLSPEPAELLALVNADSKTAYDLARERGNEVLATALRPSPTNGSVPGAPDAEPVDPEALGTDGLTVLMRAVQSGELEQVGELLSAGVKTETKAADGRRALHIAAGLDREEETRALLAAGARSDATDRDLATPLHACARALQGKGGERACRLLLAHLATSGLGSVDATDRHGATPLMEAARYGNREVWDLLLEAGADALVRNANQNSALHILALGLGGQGTPALAERCAMVEACLTRFPKVEERRAVLELTNDNLDSVLDLFRREPRFFEILEPRLVALGLRP